MIKVFIDSDVILDVLIKREDKTLSQTSIKFIDYVETNPDYVLYTSPLIIANIYYLIRKDFKKDDRLNVMRKLTKLLSLTSIGEETVKDALDESNIKDLEDMFQFKSALQANIDLFVTRNFKHYPVISKLVVKTPYDFLVINGIQI